MSTIQLFRLCTPPTVEGQITYDVESTIVSPLSHASSEPFTPHWAMISFRFSLYSLPLDLEPSSQPEEPSDWYLSILRDMGDLPPLFESHEATSIQPSNLVIETQT